MGKKEEDRNFKGLEKIVRYDPWDPFLAHWGI